MKRTSTPSPIARSRTSCLAAIFGFAVMLLAMPSAADGQLVTFRFTAEIDQVTDNGASDLATAGGFPLGTIVSGTWTVDAASPDLDAADLDRGLYAFVQAGRGIALDANGIAFETDPSAVQFTVEVRNDDLQGGVHRDEIRLVSTSNLVPAGFPTSPEAIEVHFSDAVAPPMLPPELGAGRGDALPVTLFPALANGASGASLGWNEQSRVRILENDPAGPLAGTGYAIDATIRTLEVVPTLDAARRARARIGRLEPGTTPLSGEGLLVVHYTAGTTVSEIQPGGTAYPDPSARIAWTEVRGQQLQSDPIGGLGSVADHAFHAVTPFDDVSNPAPPLLTLDLDTLPGNGPSFGGQGARWTIDLHDGVNTPGGLVGVRHHTRLFGAVGADPFPAESGRIEMPLTFDGGGRVIEKRVRSVLHFGDGTDHVPDGPEVSLVDALAWGGASFDQPTPGVRHRPYLFRESTWVHVGDFDLATASQFASDFESTNLSGTQAVSVWRSVPCDADSLGVVAANLLTLERADPEVAVLPGSVIEVHLRMAAAEVATGYAAFLEFDDGELGFLGGSYTPNPFTLNIADPIVASGGAIDLDGSVALGGDPAAGDALLASLFFEVLPGASPSSQVIGFRDATPFESTLSYEGLPIVTALRDATPFEIDTTPPSVTPAAVFSTSSDPGLCSALITLPIPPAFDACGIESVTAVRSDGQPLDAPYPAGCLGDVFTGVVWTAVDCAGNSTQAAQLIEVIDDEIPLLSCTPVVTVADPGGCTATPTIPAPVVSDNCTASPVLSFERSDDPFAPLTAPFPAGITTITWEAIDECGNIGTCVQTVEVVATNEISVDLVLPGVNASTPIDRCIRFTLTDASGCAMPVDEIVSFAGNPAFATATFTVGCGDWLEVCAKDAQHTVNAATPLSVSGPTLVGADVLVLFGGDSDDDGDIDIDDVFFLVSRFGEFATVGSCPWTLTSARDADFSNDGVVGTEDYAILASSWLLVTSCGCTGPSSASSSTAPASGVETGTWIGSSGGGGGGGAGAGGAGGAGSGPRGLTPIEKFTPAERAKIDLDRNGVLDLRDIERFERRHGLSSTVSDHLRGR